MRTILAVLLLGIAELSCWSAVVCAQEEAPTEPAENAPAAPSSTTAVFRYPLSPSGFYRGNGPGDAGNYLNLWKFAVVLAAFLFWVWCSHWVDEDSLSLKVRNSFWNSIIFGAGFAGLLCGLCIFNFYLGFLSILLCQGVSLGIYIYERNAKVPESARVMTPHHIRGVLIRVLARIGIRLGAGALVDATVGPDIRFIGKSSVDGRMDEDRSRQVENSKGYMAAKELVYDALLRRCTDIHLEPKEEELSVRMRIDGVMYPVEPFDRALGDAVVNIFKVLGAMDITEKRKSLDGSFRAVSEGRDIDFRVASQGTRMGQKLSLRILDQSNSVKDLAGMGVRNQLLEQLREIIHQPHGLLLVCGPTGAGKSTTLFASLNDIDAYQRNIITIEDPIEYKMNNVTQIEVNTKAGQTFGNSLRSVLRQDPDVVMLGEIRDSETANIACQAANTGHMVFSTIHANDSITALYRLIDLGVEPFQLSSSLSAILAQRLARRLCKQCREAYQPSPDFLKKAGLPSEKVSKFYRPPQTPEQVCPACGGLGYRGRVGVFEFLVLNERMRELLRDVAGASAIRAEARKNGMLDMKEEGLRLVVKGVTSIDELMRVVK